MLSSTFLLPFLVPATYAQLNDLAKAAGLKYFGTATENSELGDSAYVKLLSNTAEFGQITPGNSQKWDATEPSQGQFTFAGGDVVASLAKKNSQLLRCHTLIWHNQLPNWVINGNLDSKTLQAVMKTHITTEMEHYKGQCYSWDVVNEALDDDAKLREFSFFNAMGEDYIKIAFETAALADPGAKLYYNDYNIEYAGAKATAALGIVTKLVKQGVKIDGVGLQGHFIVGSMPLHDDFLKTMRTYTALGLEVAFTEMDIRMSLPSTSASLAQQSLDYENIVSACVAVDNCIGITAWDFDDKYSWVPNTFPGIGAACLFDENLNRKPAYYGVVSALESGKRNVQSSTTAPTVSATIIRSSSSTQVAPVSTTPSLSSKPTTLIKSTSALSPATPISTTSSSSPVSSILSSSPIISSSVVVSSTTIASPTISASGLTTLVSSSSTVSAPSITSESASASTALSNAPLSSSAVINSSNSSLTLATPTPSGMTTSYIPISTPVSSSQALNSTLLLSTSSQLVVLPTSTIDSTPEPTTSDSGDEDEDEDDDTCEL